MISYKQIEELITQRLQDIGITITNSWLRDRFTKSVYCNCRMYASDHYAEDAEILAMGFVNAFVDGYIFAELTINDVNNEEV